MGVALYYDLKYNRYIQVLKDLSFPGCLTCKYCVPITQTTTWKQWCIDRCVVLLFKFELSESILKQFLLLFRFKSKYGCPISSKIIKLYSISNIIQLPRGLKMISNSVPLLNYPFNRYLFLFSFQNRPSKEELHAEVWHQYSTPSCKYVMTVYCHMVYTHLVYYPFGLP